MQRVTCRWTWRARPYDRTLSVPDSCAVFVVHAPFPHGMFVLAATLSLVPALALVMMLAVRVAAILVGAAS